MASQALQETAGPTGTSGETGVVLFTSREPRMPLEEARRQTQAMGIQPAHLWDYIPKTNAGRFRLAVAVAALGLMIWGAWLTLPQ